MPGEQLTLFADPADRPVTFVLVDHDGTPLAAVPGTASEWWEPICWLYIAWKQHERDQTPA